MGYAANSTIPFKKLLADLKFELRLDGTTLEDIYLKRYIILCAKEMMTPDDYVELTATIDIVNYIAQLPCEFVKFDRGSRSDSPIVFTTNGVVANSGYYQNFSVTYTGSPFLTCSPYNSNNCQYGTPTIQVQNGRLFFSNNIGASECTISYLGLRVDASGQAIVPEANGRVIVAGGAYMYLRSIKEPYGDYQREWSFGKLDRRGEQNLPDTLEQQELTRQWNSMLLA